LVIEEEVVMGTSPSNNKVAIVTGASEGLGLALTEALSAGGWSVVVGARREEILARAMASIPDRGRVDAVVGDVTDPLHRTQIATAAARRGVVNLIVNNASTLGGSPLQAVLDLAPEALLRTFDVNVVAPIALVREVADNLAPGATVINVTSDAGFEVYPTWGGYGSSKAAIEHASRVLALERPDLRVLVVDPGEMRTAMHADAFPGEDISDRPEPTASVPGFMALIDGDQPSGRYLARDVVSKDQW
jgi:NAD(P)-dependent dehydrogenase (short-subunit alcohol dehydrogenase family)